MLEGSPAMVARSYMQGVTAETRRLAAMRIRALAGLEEPN